MIMLKMYKLLTRTEKAVYSLTYWRSYDVINRLAPNGLNDFWYTQITKVGQRATQHDGVLFLAPYLSHWRSYDVINWLVPVPKRPQLFLVHSNKESWSAINYHYRGAIFSSIALILTKLLRNKLTRPSAKRPQLFLVHSNKERRLAVDHDSDGAIFNSIALILTKLWRNQLTRPSPQTALNDFWYTWIRKVG